MIQPLKTSKTTWLLHWLDLEEPLPAGSDFFLPTLLIVSDSGGTPLAPPEIMEELDQPRVENFLIKLFERLGTPDRLCVSNSDDWDNDSWRSFSEEFKVDIRFQKFDRNEADDLRIMTRNIMVRFGREAASPARSQDVARGLVNTALRMRSYRKKIALLRTALDRDAECSSARIELADAEFQNGNWKACLGGYEEIINREEPFWSDKTPSWWADRLTRPYLRALYGKGMTLWHQGRHTDAAKTFLFLLERNPQDNQGTRFLVPMLYLLAESHEAAAAYFRQYETAYPNDYAEPSFLFGWAFSLALGGFETEAVAKYREGILKNIYITPMLLELPEPPRSLWLPNDRAEPNYASEFIESYAVLWDREPSAVRLLREVYQTLISHVENIVAHRAEMTDFQDQRYQPDYKEKWQQMVAEDDRLTEARTK